MARGRSRRSPRRVSWSCARARAAWRTRPGGSRHGSGSVPARASSIARHTRSGVHGMSMWRTPRWLSASTTAFCTAGVRADRGRLADALGAERVERRRRLGVRDLERRELGRARDRVVGERRRERVAVVVVDDLLPQRLRDARRDPAVLLAVDEQRVEDAAAVVDRDVAERLDPPGLACRPRPPRRARRTGTSRPPARSRARTASGDRRRRWPWSASSAHVERLARHAGDAEAAVVADARCRRARPRAARPRGCLRLLDARASTPRAPRSRRAAATASRRCRRRAARARCRTARSVICSIGMPSSPDTICENAVAWPWPCAEVPAFTRGAAVVVHLDRGVLARPPPAVISTYARRRRCRAASRRRARGAPPARRAASS